MNLRILFFFFLSLFFTPFLHAQFFSCNITDCGTLDPSWSLVGGSQSVVCEGESFLLSADQSTPLADIDSFRWIIYDANFSALVDTTFSDLTPFEYLFEVDDIQDCNNGRLDFQVNLVVTSFACPAGKSCRNSLEPITVILKPRAFINAPDQVCVGDVVEFENNSCFGEDYVWDFGDGSPTSTAGEPSHVYTRKGNYTVRLTATNECGSNSTTYPIEVVGLPEANAEFVLDPASGCAPVRVTFTNQVRPPGVDYSFATWEIDPDDGWFYPDTTVLDSVKRNNIWIDTFITIPLGGENFWDNKITFTDPGLYDIELTVENLCGDSTWSDTIRIYERPKVDLANPPNECIVNAGASVSVDFEDFVDYTGSICGYSWKVTNTATGREFTSTQQYPDMTFSDPGEHQVELIIDGCGCGDITQNAVFYIQTPANLTFDTPSGIICSNTAPFQLMSSVGGGNWSGSAAVSSSGTFTPSLARIGANTLDYTVGTGACQSTGSVTITVVEAPSVDIDPVSPSCDEINFMPDIDLDGTYSGQTWTLIYEDGRVVTFDPTTTSSILINDPGVHQFAVELTGDCDPVTDTIDIEIQTLAPIDIPMVPSQLCSNSAPFSIDATPTGGSWSGTGITSDGEFDPSDARIGVNTLTYTIGSGVCQSSSSVMITVVKAPSVDIEPVSAVCDEITFVPDIDLDGAYSGQTWTLIYEDGRVVTFDPTTTSSILINDPGVHQFTVELTGDCDPVTDTIDIEIQSIAPIQIQPLPSPLCSTSSPDTIRATPAGGTWSGTGVSPDGFFDPSVPTPGAAITLTYSYGQGVCSDSKSVQVTVIQSEVVTVETDLTICTDNAPYSLAFDPPGGQWTGSGFSANGIFDPVGLSPGDYEGTYLFGDVNGCEITQKSRITIEALPTIDLDNKLTFCETPDDIDLQSNLGTFTLMPSTGTITWSGNGVINASDGVFNSLQAGASGVGTYTVYLDYKLVDCEVRDSIEIEIVQIQAAEAGQNDTLCISDQFYNLVGTPAGGKWKEIGGSGNGLDEDTGEINMDLAGGGIHRYEYVFAAGTTCEVSDMVTIEIIDLTGVNAGVDQVICEGTPSFQIGGNSPAGGVWNGPGVNANGVFDASVLQPDSTYVLQYCISDPVISCSACDEVRIRLNALPVSDFQINGTNCVGENIDIENLSVNACDYFWDFGNGQMSRDIDPSPVYNQTGDYTIRLITESCEDCRDTLFFPITVTEPPFAAFSQDTDEGCAVLDVNFSNQSFGSDISMFWDFGNGQTSTDSAPGIISFEQGNNDTTYYTILAVTNGCGTVEYFDSVTVFPLPVVRFGTNVDDGCSPLEIEFGNGTLGNPETYSWYIDGVFMSNDSILSNQIFTTSDTAISYYNIRLVVDNFCGSDTLDEIITVYPPDVDAFLDVDTTSGCQPLTVNFKNFSTPGARINWDFGDGNGSSEINPVHIFDSAGVFTVYQYASNCGTDTDSIIIEVFQAPEVQFSHADYVCDGQPMQFTNESFGIKGSEWDFGDGDTSLLDSPEHIFSGPGEYLVTLTGYSDSNNCPATYQSLVKVIGNPNISFEPSVMDGCAPLSIDFLNTTPDAAFFEWDFGNGEVSSEESPQNQIFVDPGTYNVTLIGTDLFGCFSDTSIINIIVHEIPTANFSTDKMEYCSRVDEIQTGNLSSGAAQYFWTFGTAPVSTEFEPTLIPQDTGDLVVTMIAENGFGCRDTIDKTVEILGTPIASAPTDQFEGCIPFSVNFENTSQYSNEYFWDFGENSNTSTDKEPPYIYINDGDFTANLVAMNSNGCPNDTLEFFIKANPLPVSDFALSQTTVCGFLDTIFMENTSNGATDYFWTFDNGITSDLFEPQTMYSDTGNYRIDLVTTNQFGCMDTLFRDLTVLGTPEAIIESDKTADCFPAIFNLKNSSKYFTGFEWDFDDGNVNSTILTPEHFFAQAGTYEIVLQVDNSNGCPSDRDTFSITVYPKPVSDFELSETLICGLPVTVDAVNNSIGANDYAWDWGNGSTSTATNPSQLFDTPNDYPVSLIVTNEFSCKDTSVQIVSANLQPKVGFEPQEYVGCAPDTVYFENTTTDADAWFWDLGDGSFSNEFSPVHIYPEIGNYDIRLKVSYNDVCFDSMSISNALTILPSPVAAFSYADLGDGKVQFTGESQDAAFVDWDFGNGDFSDQVSPFYEYSDNGNWEVMLTATHLNGCQDKVTETVSPNIFFGFYAPNAMSPESATGDARLFKPAGIGIKNYTVKIFSPWGQLVWENSELDGEQPRGGWDGRFKGEIVPQGAYVWFAQVEFINDTRQDLKGVVNVLR